MHVFVSDIHMADNPAGDPVADAELVSFANELGRLSESGPITLVLLGDIIDFLRSPKWDHLWSAQKSAPWSAMAADFANFPRGPAEACVLTVVRDARARYAQFSATLRQLVEAERLKVLYVPGNHDFMLQVSAPLRREVQQFLSLSDDPEKPFPTVYADRTASVYATHGHTFDPVNYHRGPEGCWAFGDAIVLRVVNRFQAAACEALGCGPDTVLGRQLADIDNVEPLSDIPIYVRWLSEQLSVANQQKRILKVWKDVVDELLELPEFRDSTYSGPEIVATRTCLKLSTEIGLAELVLRYRDLLPNFERDYSQYAERIAGTQPYRFVVFGHTHDPELVPLRTMVGGQPAYYVNTGSWRRIVSRARGSVGPFVGARVSGRFLVHDKSAAVPTGRYQLHREWHTV